MTATRDATDLNIPGPVEGWVLTRVGDVADVIGGGTPSTKDPTNFTSPGDGVAWLTPADLRDFKDTYIERGSRDLSPKGLRESSARVLPPGAVLMSSRAPIGYVAIAQGEITTNQGFKSFVCRDGVVPEFIFHWLSSIEPLLQQFGSGSTFAEISGSRAREIPLLLAPTPEQRRVVAKIEPLLQTLRSSADRLERVSEILSRFRQAALAAACSGVLTENWRKENPDGEVASKEGSGRTTDRTEDLPSIPTTWRWAQFGSLTQSLRMGTTVPPGATPTNFPVLRSSSVRPMMVDLDDVRYLKSEESKNDENFLRNDDLLFTRLSGSLAYVANCARVAELDGRRIQYPDRLFRARLSDPSLGPYIECCFANPRLRAYLTVNAKSSAGHQRVSMSAITEFPIPLPPRAERDVIVRRVERLNRLAHTLEGRLALATDRIGEACRAVLVRAFRGALVPTEADLAAQEGRTYESAEELLQRIQATVSPRASHQERSRSDRRSNRSRPARSKQNG